MRPMRRTKRTLAIVAFTLVSCSSSAVPASTPTADSVVLRIYATTPMMPLLHDLTSQYVQSHPNFAFETLTGNYQTMFNSLLTGEKTNLLLTNHLPADTASNSVMAWPVGQDGIAVIVNPSNTLKGLTSEQLRAIYLGHLSNWSEIGGQDSAITVISREDGSGTRAEFEGLVMGARQTTQSAQIAPSSAAMVESVAKIRGSIGYVSMSYLDEQVRALSIDDVQPTPDTVYDNIYPLRSTIYLIGLAEPEDEYRNFVSWVQSQEGQMVVSQHYAPLLRPSSG